MPLQEAVEETRDVRDDPDGHVRLGDPPGLEARRAEGGRELAARPVPLIEAVGVEALHRLQRVAGEDLSLGLPG